MMSRRYLRREKQSSQGKRNTKRILNTTERSRVVKTGGHHFFFWPINRLLDNIKEYFT